MIWTLNDELIDHVSSLLLLATKHANERQHRDLVTLLIDRLAEHFCDIDDDKLATAEIDKITERLRQIFFEDREHKADSCGAPAGIQAH